MDNVTEVWKNALAKPWKGEAPPPKILVMRFQALGDTVITLPYLQNLKRSYPHIELHFLTRQEVSPIPKSIKLFDRVIVFGGGRNSKLQFIFVLLKLPWLFFQRYNAVLDLQNNRISRIVRKLLFAPAWTEFITDRRTVLSAGERTKKTIEALWQWKISIDPQFDFKDNTKVLELLAKNGRKPGHALVVLNPAGAFASRGWSLDSYVAFAKAWLKQINNRTQFLLLLLPSQQTKADYISGALGAHCIDLTGKASQLEAFAILQQCSFVLSEDGGLMHMAWVNGVPTLALFSSSRKDWSAPQGAWSHCLDSSDMECGPCMLEHCKYGDNRCLTRYAPEFVLTEAKKLLTITSGLRKEK